MNCDTKIIINNQGEMNFYLKLNEEQMMTIYSLLASVCGSSKNSSKKYSDQIYNSIKNECIKNDIKPYYYNTTYISIIEFVEGFGNTKT